jgi:hypothetical protein
VASRAYLLEELAAITLQGAARRTARIYPGPQLESLRALRDGKVPGAPPGLDRFTMSTSIWSGARRRRPRATRG